MAIVPIGAGILLLWVTLIYPLLSAEYIYKDIYIYIDIYYIRIYEIAIAVFASLALCVYCKIELCALGF